ncbi:hypothetical protein F6X40_11410 [Paraburkholderia sp. UCT31]|uniref:hypothetical protein n=1 Tax=Paraburkholderia sp. UCT31 TaxID=2615209 RepID=UPI001654C98E|nr:hypothetical protein [Paraburkholderia sp. UCT31]MBC8737412.1 hypothetical protein [Paraburkholderia sp. UCT31]
MKFMKEKRITYCLRDKTTGAFVRYVRGDDYDTVHRVELTVDPADDYLRVWEVETEEAVALALQPRSRYVEPTYERPSMTGIPKANLVMMKRTVEEEFEEVPFEIAPQLTQFLEARKARGTLRRYAGVDTLPEEADWLRLFELPVGETVESLKRFEGKTISFEGTWSMVGTTTLHAVFAVPEDYEPDLRGNAGFAAATTKSTV